MIIVSGANGFIGQHLVPLLLKKFKRSQILCLTGTGKTTLSNWGRKILVKNKINFLAVDLVEGTNLNKLPKSPELVIHLAANTDTGTKDHRVNDLGTRNLFNAISFGPRTHFIYTGTTVVYSGRRDTDQPITVKTKPAPTNEYGRSKLRAENFLKIACKENKIPLTIIRINTVYGNDPRKHKLFAALKNLVLKKSLTSRLNWPGLTSIIHVDDVAEIIFKIAIKQSKSNFQNFILYSQSLSLSQICQLMHQVLGKKYQSINLPDFFWQMFALSRYYISFLERILPAHLYNIFWRTGLIVDNVINCKSEKIFRLFPDWKPKKLQDTIKDTLI